MLPQQFLPINTTLKGGRPPKVTLSSIDSTPHDKIGPAFGHIDADALVQIERCLALFLGIAK
jgi:mRNA interferase MazF